MPERIKFIVAGCLHAPYIDPQAADWFVGNIERERPNVIVLNGDLLEAQPASRFKDKERHRYTIGQEYKAADEFLGRVHKAWNKAEIVLTMGNHDTNYYEVDRVPPELMDVLDWKRRDESGKYVNIPNLKHVSKIMPYCNRRKDAYRIGQVSIAHGFDCGSNSDEIEALRVGMPYGLHIRSHTHRPTNGIIRARKNASTPLPWWYANTGCLRDLYPDYMSRQSVQNWGQGCVIGTADLLKSPRMSRCWEARVDIFRMAEDVDWD
jgi:predicted phosphodiesterase